MNIGTTLRLTILVFRIWKKYYEWLIGFHKTNCFNIEAENIQILKAYQNKPKSIKNYNFIYTVLQCNDKKN